MLRIQLRVNVHGRRETLCTRGKREISEAETRGRNDVTTFVLRGMPAIPVTSSECEESPRNAPEIRQYAYAGCKGVMHSIKRKLQYEKMSAFLTTNPVGFAEDAERRQFDRARVRESRETNLGESIRLAERCLKLHRRVRRRAMKILDSATRKAAATKRTEPDINGRGGEEGRGRRRRKRRRRRRFRRGQCKNCQSEAGFDVRAFRGRKNPRKRGQYRISGSGGGGEGCGGDAKFSS